MLSIILKLKREVDDTYITLYILLFSDGTTIMLKTLFSLLLLTSLLFASDNNAWNGDYIIEFTSEGFNLELHLYIYDTPKGLRAQCSGLGRMYSREMLLKAVEEGDSLKLYYIRDNFPGSKESFEQFQGKIMLQLSGNPLALSAYDDYLISFEEGDSEEISIWKDNEGIEYRNKTATE